MYTTVNPKYGVTHPMINICYFGNAHIKNMYTFLIANGYESDISIQMINGYNVDKNDANRCLNITDFSNLDMLIENIKEVRNT